jgi:hypothetical protein
MKRIIITLISIFTLQWAWSQVASDALRYSSVQYGGTARTIGTGNSMSVLGGDYGTISINPAGLATYRASDFTFSMGYLNVNTSSGLNGNTPFESHDNKLTFNNVGLVFNSKPWGSSKWTNTNFAIGLNKHTDFNRTIFYQGNSAGSIVTLFKNQANTGQFDDFGNLLAYDAEALYDSTIAGKRRYFSDFDGKEAEVINRSQTVKTTGRVSELVISYAGNYDEKLMLGVTIGVPFAKYEFSNSYGENDVDKKIPFFNSLNIKETYKTDGTGVNIKIGAIYRPIQAVRVGLAFHSPTSYSFAETRTVDFTYNYTNNKNQTYNNPVESPEGTSNYTINTPIKTLASAGFIMGKNGFITAEIEHLNYRNAKIRFSTPDSIGQTRISELKAYESRVNEEIKSLYKSAVTMRLGGELALDVFRLRAGVNLIGSAKADEKGFRQVYTAGVGVRGKSAYLDFAYRFENQKYLYQPYIVDATTPIRQPNVDINSNSSSIVATVGYRF